MCNSMLQWYKGMSTPCQSDKTPWPQLWELKAFSTLMFYFSTILFPIHLFTSYSPFLCSKSSYSLLPVIAKKDLSLPSQSWQAETKQNRFFHPCGRENKAVITDLAFKYYHPACGASDIPAKTSKGSTSGDCITESYPAVNSSPLSIALRGDASASNQQ